MRYEGSSTDPKPAVAEKWEVSPDGLVYTFYLRKGVKFYPSGDPFDATVVKWNYDDILRPGSLALTDLFGGPKSVQYDHTEIVDNYTVKIFPKPLALFIRMVSFVAVGGIANPKWVNAHGGSPSSADKIDPYMLNHQDVTGPYIVDDFKPGDRIIMKRNPTYWMGWSGDRANRPEQVVIALVPETATRMMLLGRGDADMRFVDLPYLPELRNRIASEKLPLVIDDSPTLRDLMLTFDHFHSPTNDVHVRRASAWSFNYESYIQNIMFGFGNRHRRFMVKLNERKICWIIHETLRGRGAGEIALIQRVSHRRVEQIWQAYKRTRTLPTLKTPGRPKGEPVRLHEAALVLKVYDQLKVNALTLERVLRDVYQVELPHNKIHMILKEAGRALPQPSKQRRRKWVRYEREHSMSLWHMDWNQLSDGRWWITAMDDASRLIMNYGVFQTATAEHTIHVLKQAIEKHGCPRELLTDRGSQFYANESERREKGVSQFEAYLAEQGIKHILCRVNHPQRA